jgi:hypothetical protein
MNTEQPQPYNSTKENIYNIKKKLQKENQLISIFL